MALPHRVAQWHYLMGWPNGTTSWGDPMALPHGVPGVPKLNLTLTLSLTQYLESLQDSGVVASITEIPPVRVSGRGARVCGMGMSGMGQRGIRHRVIGVEV